MSEPSTAPKSPTSPKAAPKSPASPKATPKSPASPGSAPKSPASPGAASQTIHDPQQGQEANILPSTHWEDIPVPEDDADSAYGDAASSTASVTSSLLQYRTLNGRTYHAERGTADYWAANDELQLEAMDLHAHMCYLVMGKKLYKAPLDKETLKTALDIGTGTGVWAMDFADEFPDCQVIGTDISPIQPNWVPPNLKFEIEDCTQDWTFGDDRFDYVHLRLLYGSISDWDALFDNAYRVCSPGGWIESLEVSPLAYCDDGTLPAESALAQWGNFFIKGGRINGRTFELIEKRTQIKQMQRLGLEEIGVFEFKCPVSGWAKDPVLKEVGNAAWAAISDLEGYLSVMANIVSGWNKQEVQVFCAHMRRDLRNMKYHAYWKFRVTWGRKPAA